jgi:mono/diheme cytochrome c family protein
MLKTMNKWVLCSYPLRASSTFPEDACRRGATSGEWQGTAATLIKAAYGGDGLPNATYMEPAAPASWAAAGQTSLYEAVVAPTCRVCHQLRGTGRQSDVDFATYEKFQSYANRILATVADRGNMPLAKLIYDMFHASSGEAVLADFLVGQGLPARDAGGTVLRPGRPIADPGPDRVVRQGATPLSASNSLFADTYGWSIVSGPDGAVPPRDAMLANANTAQPTFSATTDGTYVLSLVASNASARSAPKLLSLVVENRLTPDPSVIRFSDIKATLQDGQECQGCHAPASALHAPIAFTNYDRDGDGGITPTDDAWFYAEVRSRINFTEIAASPLLQKPAGEHHFGGVGKGFDTTLAPGQPGRAKYDLFLNWIVNGAPQ